LLTTTWYQSVAQSHGPIPAKYSIYPCNSVWAEAKKEQTYSRMKRGVLDPNFLRTALLADLSASGVCWKMAVQFYMDNETTPLDAPVSWTSQFYEIAEIDLLQQTFGTQGQEDFCGYMNFNPGSSIQDHAPVGVIQAIRSAVYPAMGALRHQLSGLGNDDASINDWLNYPNM